jgi:hypothetical protein
MVLALQNRQDGRQGSGGGGGDAQDRGKPHQQARNAAPRRHDGAPTSQWQPSRAPRGSDQLVKALLGSQWTLGGGKDEASGETMPAVNLQASVFRH